MSMSVGRRNAVVLMMLCSLSASLGSFIHRPGTFNGRIVQPSLSAWSRQCGPRSRFEGKELEVTDCCLENKDYASPRAWLEHKPNGAYTVIRCDFDQQNYLGSEWKIWGQAFHENRLQQSYRAFAESTLIAVDCAALVEALNDTSSILLELLADAGRQLPYLLESDGSAYVAMVTILWHPAVEDGTKIEARGHIFTSNAVDNSSMYNPDPINVCIALAPGKSLLLPQRRGSNPLAKLSTWCSDRQPLEDRFKNADINEILLADADGDVVTILEGLTSNLFAVYPGNVLRTSCRDVLNGYARSLVLDCAGRVGFQIDFAPICLAESPLWQEVFTTSAIKLIVPVKSVFVPLYDPDDNEKVVLKPLWKDDEKGRSGIDGPSWTLLYKEIINDEYLL